LLTHPPASTPSHPPAVNDDSGALTVSGCLTGFHSCPTRRSSELVQSVRAYHVTVLTGAGLFAVPPSVDTAGNLHYTLNPNASGSATFSVTGQDDGGTANVGADTSAARTFTLTVNLVNDQPSFTAH